MIMSDKYLFSKFIAAAESTVPKIAHTIYTSNYVVLNYADMEEYSATNDIDFNATV